MTIDMFDHTSRLKKIKIMFVLGFGVDFWNLGDFEFVDQDSKVEITKAYLCIFLSITKCTCVPSLWKFNFKHNTIMNVDT